VQEEFKMSSKEELLKRLSDGVVDMEEDDVAEAAKEYLDAGYPAFDGIMEGLVDGMNRASELYEAEEYFVTDVLLCSDAMYAGLDILRPYLPETSNEEKVTGVIGVVEGDTHDIGKNLVKIMLETAGFWMIDLGRDVPLDKFVETVQEENADFICLSTLMTTTMGGMETVIKLLDEAGLRKKVKVMIGGGPISQKYADRIGADGYSQNAVEAVKLAKRLLNIA
jgi:corrinoid protein of di/trimethylamine methyltransferase